MGCQTDALFVSYTWTIIPHLMMFFLSGNSLCHIKEFISTGETMFLLNKSKLLFLILMFITISIFFLTDIKPENLLISKNDTLKLCDFGKAMFENFTVHCFIHLLVVLWLMLILWLQDLHGAFMAGWWECIQTMLPRAGTDHPNYCWGNYCSSYRRQNNCFITFVISYL